MATASAPRHQRRLDAPGTTECSDGTICEHRSPCAPHPSKEGSFMCDCAAIDRVSGVIKYAGIYCEHEATSYCQAGGGGSAHAFCTNGGECKLMVGRGEEHAGCKCPPGYAGAFCQFIEGSVPSDWNLGSFMHPQLINAYGNAGGGMEQGGVLGIVIGAAVAFVLLVAILVGYVYSGKRRQKEMDTATANSLEDAFEGPTSTASPQNASFVGGRSVYRKKTSTGQFVTEDTLEADGGVLTSVLADQNMSVIQEQDGVGESTSLDEVDLDAPPEGELA
ncbi:hypothetical protein ACHAXT_011733 [Thalassiosira profunda]